MAAQTDEKESKYCGDCMDQAIGVIQHNLEAHEIFFIMRNASGTMDINQVFAKCTDCAQLHSITQFVHEKDQQVKDANKENQDPGKST